VYPVEAIDFVLGLFTIDFLDDDVRPPDKVKEEEGSILGDEEGKHAAEG